jgi:hypothetical protein
MAAAFILIADYFPVNAWMLLEGHFGRTRYISFALGDLVLLPMVAGLAAWVLQHRYVASGWYTARWWHFAMLALGYAISIGMELTSQFNWRQEVSPSKLWHTFIFGLVFYWLAMVAIPLWLAFMHGSAGIKVAVVAATTLAVVHVFLGLAIDAKAPMKDQHLEAHYRFPDFWHSTYEVRHDVQPG